MWSGEPLRGTRDSGGILSVSGDVCESAVVKGLGEVGMMGKDQGHDGDHRAARREDDSSGDFEGAMNSQAKE
jgi:hypothetical protein